MRSADIKTLSTPSRELKKTLGQTASPSFTACVRLTFCKYKGYEACAGHRSSPRGVERSQCRGTQNRAKREVEVDECRSALAVSSSRTQSRLLASSPTDFETAGLLSHRAAHRTVAKSAQDHRSQYFATGCGTLPGGQGWNRSNSSPRRRAAYRKKSRLRLALARKT